ncbi:unnamed protein product, partial [Brassica rapa]
EDFTTSLTHHLLVSFIFFLGRGMWNDPACPARGFYTYEAFITAAYFFTSFARGSDTAARKKELAAFFGQTSYESTGHPKNTSIYTWGYCYKEEMNPPSDYCSPSDTWPCVPGKRYYGRGPVLLQGNHEYGAYGQALNADLLNNPDLVSNDPVIAFKVAILFWMKPVPPKPWSHGVLINLWRPSTADIAAGRLPGYGVITNIFNGRIECGHGYDARVADRIGFYRRYCEILGADPGDNLDCYNQRPFDPVICPSTLLFNKE